MGALRFTTEELGMLRSHPLPWFSPQARWFLDTVAPGSPAIETDENGEPTGWLIMSHHGITYREQHNLEVLRAWWAHAEAQDDPTEAHALRAVADWTAWEGLKSDVEQGAVPVEEARERAWLYIVALGEYLGVPAPVEEEDELE